MFIMRLGLCFVLMLYLALLLDCGRLPADELPNKKAHSNSSRMAICMMMFGLCFVLLVPLSKKERICIKIVPLKTIS